MLERVALHQTRLRTPGVSLDAKGVALGAKGAVLLPSLDRLVRFLSLYTAGAPLTDLLGSLTIDVVRSKLGQREILLSFSAEGGDRLDRVAELARLSGAYTFTGTSRHFVQYRDAAAPFGYDVAEITPADAAIVLYHQQFTQEYAYEKSVSLRSLLLRLEPRVAPATVAAPGPRWLCAEAGLGAALIHYFVRSRVVASVGIAEWPPASEFEPSPQRRHLFLVPDLPARMHRLMVETPGIDLYLPQGDGAAVEVGYEHPINLRACPVFGDETLALIRGGGREPLVVDKMPALGPVDAFAHVVLAQTEAGTEASRAPSPGGTGAALDAVSVPLRLAPDTDPWRNITATLVPRAELGLLRQLAYRLGRRTLETTEIAFTAEGAFLRRPQGIESLPIGAFFRSIHDAIYVSAGYAPVPAVSPEVLHRAFGSPADEVLFIHRDGRRLGVPRSAFVTLETALLDAQAWSGLQYEAIDRALARALPVVRLDATGFRPLRDVSAARPEEEGG
ncbi:MAG: hypothetical protein AAF928_06170 [Myxococcota bacterium]